MGSRSDHGLAQAAAQALQTAADAVVELDAAIAQGNAAEQRGIGAAGQADGLAGQRLEPGAQGLALPLLHGNGRDGRRAQDAVRLVIGRLIGGQAGGQLPERAPVAQQAQEIAQLLRRAGKGLQQQGVFFRPGHGGRVHQRDITWVFPQGAADELQLLQYPVAAAVFLRELKQRAAIACGINHGCPPISQ